MELAPRIVYHKSKAELALDAIYKTIKNRYESAKGNIITFKYSHIKNEVCDDYCRRLAWILMRYIFKEYLNRRKIIVPKQVLDLIFNSGDKITVKRRILELVFPIVNFKRPISAKHFDSLEIEILRLIRKYEIVTLKELSDLAKIDSTTVKHIIDRLAIAGLAHYKVIGGVIFIRADPLVHGI